MIGNGEQTIKSSEYYQTKEMKLFKCTTDAWSDSYHHGETRRNTWYSYHLRLLPTEHSVFHTSKKGYGIIFLIDYAPFRNISASSYHAGRQSVLIQERKDEKNDVNT